MYVCMQVCMYVHEETKQTHIECYIVHTWSSTRTIINTQEEPYILRENPHTTLYKFSYFLLSLVRLSTRFGFGLMCIWIKFSPICITRQSQIRDESRNFSRPVLGREIKSKFFETTNLSTSILTLVNSSEHSLSSSHVYDQILIAKNSS